MLDAFYCDFLYDELSRAINKKVKKSMTTATYKSRQYELLNGKKCHSKNVGKFLDHFILLMFSAKINIVN